MQPGWNTAESWSTDAVQEPQPQIASRASCFADTALAPSLRSFSNCEIAMLILCYHLFLSDMLR